MIKHFCILFLIAPLTAGLAASPAHADRAGSGDVLLIEKVRERMARELPANGLTMAEVEQRFGTPLERRNAVGDPPITRWIYPDYSVFFEHRLVIESVLHHEAVMREVRAER